MVKRVCDRCGRVIPQSHKVYEVDVYKRTNINGKLGKLSQSASAEIKAEELCEKCYGALNKFLHENPRTELYEEQEK